MKRTDITDLFPEASKEAIDKLLSINGADVNAVKTELAGMKDKLAEAEQFRMAGEELTKAKQKIGDLTAEIDGMKRAETVRLTRDKIAGEKNVPAHLLTGETEEACAAQADAILAFAQPKGYPSVRDGGEVQVKPPVGTRDQFADYFNKVMS